MDLEGELDTLITDRILVCVTKIAVINSSNHSHSETLHILSVSLLINS